MGLRGDDRAQSVQVGAVILFGFLIVGLATYQVTVVPSQNEQVEFEQSQAVREDLAELRNSLQTTGVTGESSPVEVKLGARFPARTLFVNPPPTSGTVRTERLATAPNASVTFTTGDTNVTSSATGDADDYWDTRRNFTAKLLVYDGNYRVYDAAPRNVSIQFGHAVASYPGDRIVNVTDAPNLVQNDRVTLVLVQGNLSQNGVDPVTVDPSSVSQITRREEVSGVVNVTVPTTLSLTNVRELFAPINASSPLDISVGSAPGQAVNVTLNTTGTNTTVKLGVAAVSVGAGAPERSPAYVDVESFEDTVVDGQSGEVVVEVRDQYGNPVSGVRVNASTMNGSGNLTLTDSSVVTGPNGLATFSYTGQSPGDATINVSFDSDPDAAGFDAETPEDANVSVVVTPDPNAGGGGGGGGAGTVNPPNSVQLVDSFVDGNDEAVFVLRNTGNTTVTLDRSRVSFYFNRQGNNDPTSATFVTSDNQPTMQVAGDFVNVDNVTFPPGVDVPICFRFSGGGGSSVENDFFVTSFEFDDGSIRQYFVTPQGSGPSCQSGGTGGGGGGGGGDPFPSDPAIVAFNDADGDDVYDSSERTYTVSDLESGSGVNSTVDLVVEKNFTTSGIDLTNINSVLIKEDITSDGKLVFRATNEVTVRPGVSLFSDNGNNLELRSDTGSVTVEDATLSAASELVVIGALVDGAGATLTGGSGGVTIESTSTQITLDSTNITSGGAISITSAAELSLQGAFLDNSGTGDNAIDLVSNGNMDLRSAELQGDSGSDFTADLSGGSNTLFVQDAEIKDGNGNGKTLVYDPNGITVQGSPAVGSVSKN